MTPMDKADVTSFLGLLAKLGTESGVNPSLSVAEGLFDASRPLTVARAPGRLDVMGGIADYSGSLVLQMPIGEAALVALQVHPLSSAAGKTALVRSVSLDHPPFTMPLAELFAGNDGGPTELDVLRGRLAENPETSWASYVVGVVAVLAHTPETREALRGSGGVSILVSSSVPEGKGVSSSAAVEVRTRWDDCADARVTLRTCARGLVRSFPLAPLRSAR